MLFFPPIVPSTYCVSCMTDASNVIALQSLIPGFSRRPMFVIWPGMSKKVHAACPCACRNRWGNDPFFYDVCIQLSFRLSYHVETLKAGDETIAKQLANKKAVHEVHNRTTHPKNMEGSQYGDIFQERKQKRHQEPHTNLLAIKYVQTVHKNHNN